MENIILEDDDQRIHYAGFWSRTTSDDRSVSGGGFHRTSTAIDKAQISFTGVKISVYGILNNSATLPTSTYLLDQSTEKNVFTPTSTTSDLQFGQKFFESPDLPLGNHTLQVQLIEGENYILDYVVVQKQPSGSTSQSQTSSPSSPTPTSSAVSQGTQRSLAPGSIVGITVGIALLLIFLASAVFFVLMRRRKSRMHIASEGGNAVPQQMGQTDVTSDTCQPTVSPTVKSHQSLTEREDENPPEYRV